MTALGEASCWQPGRRGLRRLEQDGVQAENALAGMPTMPCCWIWGCRGAGAAGVAQLAERGATLPVMICARDTVEDRVAGAGSARTITSQPFALMIARAIAGFAARAHGVADTRYASGA